MLPSVALGDGDDQLLADVAREIEVDVGDGVELAIDEAPEREAGLDGIDVREAGQVADDRADRAAAAPARRERVSGRVTAAHLIRDVAGELEHLVMEQEEAGETELVDQAKLLLEAGAGVALVAVGARVAL